MPVHPNPAAKKYEGGPNVKPKGHTMTKLFANPTVRLAARALVAALIVVATQIHNSNGGQIAWQALAVGAGLAFAEVFTPLNSLVNPLGKLFAKPVPSPPVTPPPAAPVK